MTYRLIGDVFVDIEDLSDVTFAVVLEINGEPMAVWEYADYAITQGPWVLYLN